MKKKERERGEEFRRSGPWRWCRWPRRGGCHSACIGRWCRPSSPGGSPGTAAPLFPVGPWLAWLGGGTKQWRWRIDRYRISGKDGWMGKERKTLLPCRLRSVSCLITNPSPHAFSRHRRQFLWLVKPARGRDVTGRCLSLSWKWAGPGRLGLSFLFFSKNMDAKGNHVLCLW
jgi:hypothetical protein